MLSRAQNTFHHNPRLRGPVSSCKQNIRQCHLFIGATVALYNHITYDPKQYDYIKHKTEKNIHNLI